tara:strand:+ start:327 stop:893 length:567 start_codon:yes stop_codon:yes gene_type:complete
MAKAVIPLIAGFKAIMGIADRIQAATPPAKLEYLRGVNIFVHHVATNPYVPTCLNMNTANSNSGTWHFAQMVNIASRSGRACVGRSVTAGTTGAISNAETYSSSSGSTSNDAIVIACESINEGTDAYPITYKRGIDIATEGYDATPSQAMDRQYEIATALAPALEKFSLNRGHSWGMLITCTGDMSAL